MECDHVIAIRSRSAPARRWAAAYRVGAEVAAAGAGAAALTTTGYLAQAGSTRASATSASASVVTFSFECMRCPSVV